MSLFLCILVFQSGNIARKVLPEAEDSKKYKNRWWGGGSHIGGLYTAGASNLLQAMVYS